LTRPDSRQSRIVRWFFSAMFLEGGVQADQGSLGMDRHQRASGANLKSDLLLGSVGIGPAEKHMQSYALWDLSIGAVRQQSVHAEPPIVSAINGPIYMIQNNDGPISEFYLHRGQASPADVTNAHQREGQREGHSYPCPSTVNKQTTNDRVRIGPVPVPVLFPSGKDRRPPPDRCMTATYRVAEPNSIHATLAQQGGAEYSPTTSPNHDHPTDQVPYVGLFSRAWETSSSRGQRLQLSFNSEGTRNARQVTGFPGGPAYLGQAETSRAQAIP